MASTFSTRTDSVQSLPDASPTLKIWLFFPKSPTREQLSLVSFWYAVALNSPKLWNNTSRVYPCLLLSAWSVNVYLFQKPRIFADDVYPLVVLVNLIIAGLLCFFSNRVATMIDIWWNHQKERVVPIIKSKSQFHLHLVLHDAFAKKQSRCSSDICLTNCAS